MSFAVSRHLRADNPVRGVKRYPDRKGETFLSAAELANIGGALARQEAAGANPSATAIIRLLAFTGARKGEIADCAGPKSIWSVAVCAWGTPRPARRSSRSGHRLVK
jgi:hypothetical protein